MAVFSRKLDASDTVERNVRVIPVLFCSAFAFQNRDRSTRRAAAVFNPTDGASGGYNSCTRGSLRCPLLSLWGMLATRRSKSPS